MDVFPSSPPTPPNRERGRLRQQRPLSSLTKPPPPPIVGGLVYGLGEGGILNSVLRHLPLESSVSKPLTTAKRRGLTRTTSMYCDSWSDWTNYRSSRTGNDKTTTRHTNWTDCEDNTNSYLSRQKLMTPSTRGTSLPSSRKPSTRMMTVHPRRQEVVSHSLDPSLDSDDSITHIYSSIAGDNSAGESGKRETMECRKTISDKGRTLVTSRSGSSSGGKSSPVKIRTKVKRTTSTLVPRTLARLFSRVISPTP